MAGKKRQAKKAKEAKTKKPEAKKAAMPKQAEAKEGAPKISAIVKDGLDAKPPLTYEKILNNVLKLHPGSKFNKKHLSWYKNRLGHQKKS